MARSKKREKNSTDDDISLWWMLPDLIFTVIPFLGRCLIAAGRGIAALFVAVWS